MKIIVYHNEKKGTYYYKVVKGYYKNYTLNQYNHYAHKIILIIDNIYYKPYKQPFRNLLLTKFILFLEKLKK